MLVVKVEIWPLGNEHAAKQIGQMNVWNISDLSSVADYMVQTDSIQAKVRGHERSKGFWELVKRAIQAFQDAKGEP